MLALLCYVAPIIVGVVLVFFMIKPLFARRPKDYEPHRVLPGEEPELFRLVYAVCDTVRAPRPARVLVDFQVNAFAGLSSRTPGPTAPATHLIDRPATGGRAERAAIWRRSCA